MNNKYLLPKISVIVPVHNAGTYFTNCLNSIANQTLTEIEVILVLDCPTDGSDTIAENFAAKDSRFKLIYNEANLHTGLSRNKGMLYATGEYIGFCDHDDYIDPTMYEKLYQKAKSDDCDIVRCNSVRQKNGRNMKFKYPDLNTNENISQQLFSSMVAKRMSGSIWNYIFKTTFVQKHNILFPDNRVIAPEDEFFLVQTFFYAARVSIIHEYLYYHILHQSNLATNINYQSTKNVIAYYELTNQFLNKNSILLDEKTMQIRAAKTAYSLYCAFSRSLRCVLLRQLFKELQLVKNHENMMNALRLASFSFSTKHLNLKFIQRLKIICFFLIITLTPRKKARTF